MAVAVGHHTLNYGHGKLVRGEGPLMLTNTHSVGVVRDTVIAWQVKNKLYVSMPGWPDVLWSLPVVEEGNVGGGTGMSCHQFKGGIGTASRMFAVQKEEFTLGVLVQANYGTREMLIIAGVPVGREITDLMPEYPTRDIEFGSIIVAIATDAAQC